MRQDVRDFLVRQNGSGTAREKLTHSMSQLGLKLPVDPSKIKSGPKGQIIVQKGLDEQWSGEFGGFYLYGGLHGKRVIGKDGHEI